MKKGIKTLILASVITIGTVVNNFSVFALTKRNATNATVGISSVSTFTVNYYMPLSNGSGFALNSSEQVANNATLSHIPTTSDIDSYTFEKWSTSNALSDSFNTSSAVTSSLNLYAAYKGYFAKTNNNATYHKLTKSSGSINRYLGKDSNTPTAFNYTYKLDSTSLNGYQATVYSCYLTKSSYTTTGVSTSLLNGNTTNFTHNHSLYFNGSTLVAYRRIYVELSSSDGSMQGANIHMWQGNSRSTAWPGLGCTWYKDDGNKKFYFMDIETSTYSSIKVTNSGYNSGCYRESSDLTISAGANNCVWLNSGGSGWYTYNG